jgi:peroxiredoxin Q/BCP
MLGQHSRAPVFPLPGSDGKTHRLSDYTFKGKTVVLACFPKAFTAG